MRDDWDVIVFDLVRAERISAAVTREPSPTQRAKTLEGPPLAVDNVLREPGHPLDGPTNAFLSARFGHNFSRVRVHSDSRAAATARAFNAHAYTAGNHIVFGPHEYQPRTWAGIHLLAHEAAHTIQQEPAAGLRQNAFAIAPSRTPHERDADAAADRALSGGTAEVRTRLPFDAACIQRAEIGTYVSTVGTAAYLDAGAKFYKFWGYPHVKRVANMQDILQDLDTFQGPFDKFRIVSHGIGQRLELGMLPGISVDSFDDSALKFTTEQKFREFVSGFRISDKALYSQVVGALRKDAKAAPLLAKIGVTANDPGEDEPLGIVIRALIDRRLLAEAQDSAGKPVVIKNQAALDRFVALRLAAYKPMIVGTFPLQVQPEVGKAIDDLGGLISPVMQAAKITFAPFTQAEADTLADAFIEDAPGGAKRLKQGIGNAITEGATGNPYLKKLRSVQAKINENTHVEIRGCTIGRYPTFVDKLRTFFGGAHPPSMSAPDLYQYFYQVKSFQAYGRGVDKSKKDWEAQIAADYADPAKGISSSFRDSSLIKGGAMTRVVNETTLADLCTKYGFNLADVTALNPEADPQNLAAGQEIWLRQRRTIKAGSFKTLDDVSKQYLKKPGETAKLAAANPAIKDPKALNANDDITCPNDLLTPPVVTEPTLADFKTFIRAGNVVPAGDNANELYMDAPTAGTAIGKWLAGQQWDPNGQTAAALTKLYSKNLGRIKDTSVEFLSRDYPTIVDPLFPDDPRYSKHIIQRP